MAKYCDFVIIFLPPIFVIPEKSGIQRGWGFWIPNQVGNDISIFGFGLSGLGDTSIIY